MMVAALEEPLIQLCERKITGVQELLPILEQVVKLGRPLLVIAEDVDGDALATLVVNRVRGMLTGATLTKVPEPKAEATAPAPAVH